MGGSLICKLCGGRYPADADGELARNPQTGHKTDFECKACVDQEYGHGRKPQNVRTGLRRG